MDESKLEEYLRSLEEQDAIVEEDYADMFDWE
jgi:hypothetical protein